MMRDGAALRLPMVTIERDWVAADVGTIQAAAYDALGIDAVVLRELAGGAERRIAELECLSAAPNDARGVFVDLAAVTESFADSEDRATIERWLSHVSAADAPAWSVRGWFLDAVRWMDARLADIGAVRTRPVRQVKGVWADSAVLVADSTAGIMYLKATAPGSLEPAVLAALHERGRPIPDVVACDNTNNIILMRAAAGHRVAPPRFAAALRQFGDLQRAEASDAGEWRALGLTDRGPRVLRERIERIFVDIPSQLRRGGVLSDAEAIALAGYVPRAAALCERLAECGIPDSLVHDDFQPGNVIDLGDGFAFLDWSDVAVAHPFFSAHHFIACAGDEAPASLRDAAIEPWVSLVGQSAAGAAFDTSATLLPMYRAVFNDRMPDHAAWLATNPPQVERDFARSVFTTLLAAFSAGG